jgi:hypothetical protein
MQAITFDSPEYIQAMNELAVKFQLALQESLARPYPFAPGYSGSKQPFGVRNMRIKTGFLYNSIKVNFSQQTNEIVVTMADYWKNVNDGRRPGKYVPIRVLMQWIRTKGFNKNKKTGKFEKFNIKGMAFAVSKSIQKFGIQPTYFYDKAFTKFEKVFEEDAYVALGIDIETFFERVVDEVIVKPNKK